MKSAVFTNSWYVSLCFLAYAELDAFVFESFAVQAGRCGLS